MRRYLYGPVSPSFAEQNLSAARRNECLAFGPAGPDLELRPDATWESLTARLPPNKRPDFLVLHLAYTDVPEGLWAAPVPIVGLATDWNLLWHLYRHLLPRCDLVLTDTAGVAALARDGLAHARPANLFGCERELLEREWPETDRDIDVLFVGNFSPAVQRERTAYLARLARLSPRWNVVLRTATPRAEYLELLGRARVVFNRSIRGECNLRTFEAAAAGALLFQEAGNLEVPSLLADRRECVFYTDEDLETLLEHYLTNEDQRQGLADAARQRVEGYRFDALWRRALGALERDWPAIEERSRVRPAPDAASALTARVWQAACATAPLDPRLERDLGLALAPSPDAAPLHQAAGTLLALQHLREQPDNGTLLARSADQFRLAAGGSLGHPLARLNHAELLAGLGQADAAAREVGRLLEALDASPRLEPTWPDGLHVPPVWDTFRVEWEAAGWQNAGEPALEGAAKVRLLRWRAHALLADLTGRLEHHEEAVRARPDLAPTQAALGCALGRAGRPADAVRHLQAAVAGNPLDLDAARALGQALADTGAADALRELKRARDRLHAAAPQAVPAEAWFVGAARWSRRA